MRQRTILIGGIAFVLVFAGLYLYSQPQSVQWTEDLPGKIATYIQPIPPNPDLAEGAGRLEAQEFELSSKTGGRILSISVDEGDAVEKGDRLVQIDTRELDAGIRRAEAELLRAKEGRDQAEASVEQRQADVALADAQLRRAIKQYTSDSAYEQRKAVHDNAEAALLLSRSQLRAADATIKVARAELDRLHVQKADADIVAPRRGRVLYKLAQNGEIATPGQRLLTLIDLDDVFLTIFLPMEQAGRLAIGEQASVTLDALPDRPMSAVVDFISPRAQFTPKTVETRDERTKFMFRIKLRITDRHGVPINPGLPAVGRIHLAKKLVSLQP
jgi:HlyD family secretion protein